jgi:ATP-GRASP peptide maturase of grasp-with-spasm system
VVILILSQDRWELTTEEVQDWIETLGGDCIRLNGEDLNGQESLTLSIDGDKSDLLMIIGGREVRLGDIGAVWMRRWHMYRNLSFLDDVNQPALARDIRQHLVEEIRSLTTALGIILAKKPHLALPHQRRVNKCESLILAKNVGLDVPATLITNHKSVLQDFKQRHGRIIAKSVAEGRSFFHHGTEFSMYTSELEQSDIDQAPTNFFPTLVQELLVKEFDVRTFYLAGSCYSMAIFSQQDQQTTIDFRRYNDMHPNRTIPYRLPDDVELKIEEFMNASDLITGSLDFVRTRDGRHVFLEVNPVGQFKMVSEPCNYRLEKIVAEYLIALDCHVK